MKKTHTITFLTISFFLLLGTFLLNRKINKIQTNINDHVYTEIHNSLWLQSILDNKLKSVTSEDSILIKSLLKVYKEIKENKFDGYNSTIRNKLTSLNDTKSVKINESQSNISIFISILNNKNYLNIFQHNYNPILIIDEFKKLKGDSVRFKVSFFNELTDNKSTKFYLNDQEITYKELKTKIYKNSSIKAIITNPVSNNSVEFKYQLYE